MTREEHGVDRAPAPRRSMASSPGRLDEMPLDPSTIAEVRAYRAETTSPVAHAARLTTWRCVTREGARSPDTSESLRHPPTLEPLEPGGEQRVAFESDAGLVTRAQVELPAGTDLYGAGELAASLRRNGRNVTLWTTDTYAYGDQETGLYQAHPFVLGLHSDGSATGIVADCARRGWMALCEEGGVELRFEGGPFDVILIDAGHPAEALRALAALIGTIALPPRWALGYHQCRYSYMDEAEVRALATRLRSDRVPCDAVWFDIDYMDRCRDFTWDPQRFPDPRRLTDDLRGQGFRSVAILDPGIVADPSDSTCASGLAGEHFIVDSQGTPARGRVWPGVCHFPDFTRPETRAWWAECVGRFAVESGLDGLWNDMNEPAVFRTPTRTLHTELVHRGLGGGNHARFHNLYGHLMVTATHQGMVKARPEQRPFVLTRSAHLSTSAIAATWTGDNQSCWEDLEWSISMVLSLGLSGQPIAGPDVGGFTGDPEEELFVRFFEAAALLPFCRGHAEKGTRRKEPWAFGERALSEIRAALELRMRMLPTLYTLCAEASTSGLPVARPLFLADPRDARLRTVGPTSAFPTACPCRGRPGCARSGCGRSGRLSRPSTRWARSSCPQACSGSVWRRASAPGPGRGWCARSSTTGPASPGTRRRCRASWRVDSGRGWPSTGGRRRSARASFWARCTAPRAWSFPTSSCWTETGRVRGARSARRSDACSTWACRGRARASACCGSRGGSTGCTGSWTVPWWSAGAWSFVPRIR